MYNFIHSVAVYGCEVWVINDKEKKRKNVLIYDVENVCKGLVG